MPVGDLYRSPPQQMATHLQMGMQGSMGTHSRVLTRPSPLAFQHPSCWTLVDPVALRWQQVCPLLQLCSIGGVALLLLQPFCCKAPHRAQIGPFIFSRIPMRTVSKLLWPVTGWWGCCGVGHHTPRQLAAMDSATNRTCCTCLSGCQAT